MSEFQDLDKRSREIFQRIVESYLVSGEPVGSLHLSKTLSEKISPATIRNVMANLETLGLLNTPHTSAGRLPTELGLRFFVDGILEMKSLSRSDELKIGNAVTRMDNRENLSGNLYERTGSLLSEISNSASLIFSHKQDVKLKHIDFVWLSNTQALVILVDEHGQVDNRLFEPAIGMTSSDLERAANFINAHIKGRTISEFQQHLEHTIKNQQQEIDDKMAYLISIGRAALVEGRGASQLVVRGRSNLIDDTKTDEEIDTLRQLMDDLENKRDLIDILELSEHAQAVRIFIGSENKLFSLKTSSLVVSPYMNGEGKIIGAVGVIGPTRLNYARIVPLVSYTASAIGHFLSKNEDEHD